MEKEREENSPERERGEDEIVERISEAAIQIVYKIQAEYSREPQLR